MVLKVLAVVRSVRVSIKVPAAVVGQADLDRIAAGDIDGSRRQVACGRAAEVAAERAAAAGIVGHLGAGAAVARVDIEADGTAVVGCRLPQAAAPAAEGLGPSGVVLDAEGGAIGAGRDGRVDETGGETAGIGNRQGLREEVLRASLLTPSVRVSVPPLELSTAPPFNCIVPKPPFSTAVMESTPPFCRSTGPLPKGSRCLSRGSPGRSSYRPNSCSRSSA